MRKGIHPKCRKIAASYPCDSIVKIRSAVGHDPNLDVCNKCHLFSAGKQRDVATSGHIDRFNKRFSVSGNK